MRAALYKQIRGLIKTFGIVLPPGKGGTFVRHVESKLPADPIVQTGLGSLLTTWRTITAELKKLDNEIKTIVRDSDVHKNLMTVPGVGVVTAAAYVATIDAPQRFSSAKDVGAYLGLTPRRISPAR